MRIERVSFHNYKSLREVTFEPAPMSVLIGANGAGKSNALDAFGFLSDLFRVGLDIAVRNRGGVESIWYHRERRSKGELAIDLCAAFSTKSELRALGLNDFRAPIRFRYRLSFKTAADSLTTAVRVVTEGMQLQDGHDQPILSLERRGNKIRSDMPDGLASESPIFRSFFSYRLPMLVDLELQQSETFFPFVERLLPTFTYIAKVLGSMHLFQISPHESRQPGVMSATPELEAHGGNLPAVLIYLKEKESAVYEKIMAVMRAILPWLEEMSTGYTTDRRLGLYFKEAGINRTWYADQISDGSIRTLALLTAIADPRTSIILLEEPENYIHPWILEQIYDFCKETAKTKQLLITTHSPLFLNKLTPEQIFVVSRRDFATRLEPLTALEDKASLADLQLGDYWVAGGIPSALPPVEGGHGE